MDIDKIVSVVDSGGLVITPTDTVYGIMGDSLDESVIRKVYSVKRRTLSKPLILLMSDVEMIKNYTSDISDVEWDLINHFLPGLVTIILKKNDLVSPLITSNSDYVGIRIPNNSELVEIIKKLGRPVISTSANISDRDVITSVDMISDELLSGIDYVYDGGEINSLSSTIIRVVDGKLVILRCGELADDIESYFSKLEKN
jgi:tRNA threonylcarbamoyl adenosine modification protein (Sua5/YciO/YrdC/YwlC family)